MGRPRNKPTWDELDPQSLKTPFHRNLQRLLLEQGHTPAGIARKLGISDVGAYKWFDLEAIPNVTTFSRLAETLGVTMDELWKEAA